MFYAVRLCGNPNHERYKRPIEFMTIGGEMDDVPIETNSEIEMFKILEDNELYKAGWVEIIEID